MNLQTGCCSRCGAHCHEIQDNLVPVCNPVVVDEMRRAQIHPETAIALRGLEIMKEWRQKMAVVRSKILADADINNGRFLVRPRFGPFPASWVDWSENEWLHHVCQLLVKEGIATQLSWTSRYAPGITLSGWTPPAAAAPIVAEPAPIEPHERPMSKAIIDEWTRRR